MKNPFRTPTACELAQRQLAEAERELLLSEAQEERAKHNTAMLRERVQRLRDRATQRPTVTDLLEVAA